MKRTRKQSAPRPAEPTPNQIRCHMQLMVEEHQQAWQRELTSATPYWVYLLSLHLRMVELEQMEAAIQEWL